MSLSSWSILPSFSEIFCHLYYHYTEGLLSGSVVKNLPAMQETQETRVQSLGWVDPLEDGMATHSIILAWRSHGQRTWLATVHRVAKSWTWLKQWSMHSITLSCFTGGLPVTELFFWGFMFFLHLEHIPLLSYFVLMFCDCRFHSSVCRVVVLASAVCPWWMRLSKRLV